MPDTGIGKQIPCVITLCVENERCQKGDQDHDPGKSLKTFDIRWIRQKVNIDLRTQSMGEPQAKHTQTRVQKHLHLDQYISFALKHG